MRNQFGLKKVGILMLIILLIWTGIPSASVVGSEKVPTNEEEIDQDETSDGETEQKENEEEQDDSGAPANPEEESGDNPVANEPEEKQDTPGNDKANSPNEPVQVKKQGTDDKELGIQAVGEGNFEYANNSIGRATITGYTGPWGIDLEIPSELGGLTVTRIGSGAFQHQYLTSVTIPDSVESIDHDAFLDNAFTRIELPKSVNDIADNAFGYNSRLEEISVADGNPSYKDIDGKGLYTLDGKTLVVGTNHGTIVEGTKIIGYGAFRGLYVTGITIPEGVEEISSWAFSHNDLEEIIIPESVKRIGANAFRGNSLQQITIPENVVYIGSAAFWKNFNLKDVMILGSPEFVSSSIFEHSPATLEITGYNGTSVEEHAQENGYTFNGFDPVQVTFTPNGRAAGDMNPSTQLTVKDFKPGESLQYTWSTSEESPTTGWADFTNGDTLDKPNHSEKWYLHVRVTGLLGNTVDNHSGAFQPLFAVGDGTKDNPYIIETADQLDGIRHDLDAHYKQGADIDLSEYSSGRGWEPIGDNDNPFMGSFNGNVFTISNLTMNRSGNYQGLFGVVGKDGLIQTTSLEEVKINARNSKYAGGLVGHNLGKIKDSSVKGSEIRGWRHVGGLVGDNQGMITDSFAMIDVLGLENYSGEFSTRIGGLVGSQDAKEESTAITNSYATGNVSGFMNVGGLVGAHDAKGGATEITNSYATGRVKGDQSVGGLTGQTFASNNGITKITNSYAIGDVEGRVFIGGLVGDNRAYDGTIETTNSYATGKVDGSTHVGGLVGYHTAHEGGRTEITNSYAVGKVLGSDGIGGLAGTNSILGDGVTKITSSYWDIDSTEQTNSAGGEGKSSAEMMQLDTYKGWDFDGVWYQYEDKTLPIFQWQNSMTALDVSIAKDTLQIGDTTEITVEATHEDGNQYSGEINATYSANPDIVDIKNGKVTAKKGGKATITVWLHGESKKLYINVIPDPPKVGETPKITNTDKVEITGTAQPDATIDIRGGNTDVAGTVDADGKFLIDVPLNQNTKNTLQVTATVDGLVSDPTEVTIVHDNEKPEQPTITIDPEGWTNADEVDVVINEEEKGEDLSGIETIRVKVGDEAWADYQYEDVPINLIVETEGETKIKAQAIDAIGNESDIVDAIVKIDRTAPIVTFGTDGNDEISKGASTKVTVEDKSSGLDEDSLAYVWSTNSDTPSDVDWESFASGDEIEKTDGNGKWYLHIRATDNAGNTANISSNAFHLDNTQPEIDVMMTHGDDEVYKQGTWTNQTVNVSVKATDEHSEIDSLQILIDGMKEDQHEFLLQESGVYTLTITATDEVGNKTTENRAIKISKEGLTLETALEQADGTVYESGNWTKQDVTASMDAYNTDGAEVTKKYSLDKGETWKVYTEPVAFSEGTYSVWFQAEDEAGNAVIEKGAINIDQTAPELKLRGDKIINLLYSEEFDDPGYEVTDNNLDENIFDKVIVDGEVDIEKVGSYEITYSVKDHAGNKAIVTRTVNINDEKQPVITLEGDNPFVIEVGTVYEEPGTTAKDNVDGDISSKVEITGEVDVNKIGVYEIRYNVSDEAGNNAFEAVREVHVIAPEIIWLELDKLAVPIYAGSLAKIKDTKASVQLPTDLPAGTTLKVESVDISVEGYEQAGDVLNFIFNYPDGEEEYVGNFGLTLGVYKDAKDVAIYYYNENEKALELIGGEKENGLITTTVNHFSTYGVLSLAEEEEKEIEEVVPPKEEKVEEITPPKGDEKDSPLPNTATNVYNWLLLGGLFIIFAIIILGINRKRKQIE